MCIPPGGQLPRASLSPTPGLGLLHLGGELRGSASALRLSLPCQGLPGLCLDPRGDSDVTPVFSHRIYIVSLQLQVHTRCFIKPVEGCTVVWRGRRQGRGRSRLHNLTRREHTDNCGMRINRAYMEGSFTWRCWSTPSAAGTAGTSPPPSPHRTSSPSAAPHWRGERGWVSWVGAGSGRALGFPRQPGDACSILPPASPRSADF